jgi:hypothetical protein
MIQKSLSSRQEGRFSPIGGAAGDRRERIGIVDAQNKSELAALAARVEELSQTCTRLSQENAQLRGMVAQMTAASPAATVTEARNAPPARQAQPMSRRSIGRALGAAAAGVVGAAVLTDATAGKAAAATGDAMTAGHAVNAEAGTGVEYDGGSNPGAIFGADDSGSFPGALLGAALTHPAAILGNATAAVNNGVYGNTAHPDGGDGVVGVNNSKSGGTGVHGIARTDQTHAIGVLGENSGGIAVQGNGGTVGVLGSGTTAGVQGITGNTLGTGVLGSGAIGVHGLSANGFGVNGTSGTGIGVGGSSNSSIGVLGLGKTGMRGDGSGSGSVGVRGSGTRGAVFAGNAAQLKLAPGSKSTHPASGQRGDLYADSKGRLWFCKGGASWHQVA